MRFNESTDLPFRLAVSVGTAAFRPDGVETLDDLLARADAEMYRDKHDA